MSLSATLFGTDSLIFKATNILGLGIPGLLHKTFGPGEPEAQRMGEISRQTAKEGDPRVIVWGRVRPIGGNIIHCQKPVKRMVKQSSSGGGKGGSKKKEQKVEHVFRTYAIGVCEGPITGFSRIWRNNKLVYDARGNKWGAKNNPVFLKKFRLYLGGWAQMPDPTLQSIWGAGNVPAYRGTAYMVSVNEDLTDQGGMVPQWQFEVERAEGVYYTSRPYAIEAIEDVQAGNYAARITPNPAPDDVQAGQYELISAVLREPLVSYTDGIPDEIQAGQYAITGATLRAPLIAYTNGIPDEAQAGQYTAISGNLRLGLITYANWPEEEVQSGQYTVTGATLT